MAATGSVLTDDSFRWGIYEKALPRGDGWASMLASAAAGGFQFVEISVDESDGRLARLWWPVAERRALHEALDGSPVKIDTMCLSGHRRFPMGSEDAKVRTKAMDITRRAIDFAAEFGLRIVQVAGYDEFYNPSTERSRALYAEGLHEASVWARGSCVMLALENMDWPAFDSIEEGMRHIRACDTPWLQMYPDIGNLTAMQKDVRRELLLGGRSIVGVHLKDTRIGTFQRVALGTGLVDFDAAFRTLAEMGFRGIFNVEMWNDREADPVAVIRHARGWLGAKLRAALAAR
jgi:L-ribulose-5-phosphate 3-epimerase